MLAVGGSPVMLAVGGSPVMLAVGGSSVVVLGGSVVLFSGIGRDCSCLIMLLQYSDISFSPSYPQHDTLKGEVPSTVLTHELEERLHIVDSLIVSRL